MQNSSDCFNMAPAKYLARNELSTELKVESTGPQAEREGLHTKGRKQQAPRGRKPIHKSVPAEGSLVKSKDQHPHDQKEQQLSIKTTSNQTQGYYNPQPPFMLQPVDWQPQGPGYFNLWKYHSDGGSYVPHCFYHASLGWCLPTFFVNPARLDRWHLADMQYGSAVIVSCDYHPEYGYAARVQVCMGSMNHPARAPAQVCDGPMSQPVRVQVCEAPMNQPDPPPRQIPLLGAWAKPLAAAASMPSAQQQPKQSKNHKKHQRKQGKAAAAAAAVREAAAALKAQGALAETRPAECIV